jgi:antitoxin CptB
MEQASGRLRWQCRRGMLELDVILKRFVDQHWQSLDNELKAEFEILLSCSDQQLQKWLCEGKEAENEVTGIVNRLRQSDCNQAHKISAYHHDN